MHELGADVGSSICCLPAKQLFTYGAPDRSIHQAKGGHKLQAKAMSVIQAVKGTGKGSLANPKRPAPARSCQWKASGLTLACPQPIRISPIALKPFHVYSVAKTHKDSGPPSTPSPGGPCCSPAP